MKDASRSVPTAGRAAQRRPARRSCSPTSRPTTTRCARGTRPRTTGRWSTLERRPRQRARRSTGRLPPAAPHLLLQQDHASRRSSASAASQHVRVLRDYDLRAASLHRLAAVLQRLGDEGRVPRHPQQPDDRRDRAASSTTTRRRCSTGSIEEKWLTANGVVGFFPANAVGDDIEVYPTRRAARCSPRCTTCASRASTATGVPNRSLGRLRRAQGDRPARTTSARFAVTAGLGTQDRIAAFKAELDDYSAILLESLADRLAEAFAERLHERVRTRVLGLRARRAPRQRRT